MTLIQTRSKHYVFILIVSALIIVAGISGCDESDSDTNVITSFSFLSADNDQLNSDVTGTITGSSINVLMPFGSDITQLTASFSTSGERVSINDVSQASGETENDFSLPVIYTVTAGDGSQREYTVTVTISHSEPSTSKVADHTIMNMLRLGQIPETAITGAKTSLHIGYGHTSHGSQITSGMTGLVAFANNGGLGRNYSQNLFAWNRGGSGGALDLQEGSSYNEGPLDHDCGYYPNWVNETREFLNDSDNSEINVIIWSWCGQVTNRTEATMISTYLEPMSQLEAEYPGVTFVYMTGHLNRDGTAPDENTHLRNEQIRTFCRNNNKWLFDFADIESYDPDGNYYGDRLVNDEGYYDSNGNQALDENDSNWATEWQNDVANNGKWYTCGSSHTQPLSANQKAYAAWWLWSRLAGWDGTPE